MGKLFSDEQIASIRKTLLDGAQRAGKTIEAHAADEIADLKTSAKDSIIRALVAGVALGVFVTTVAAVLIK